jgi:hypothetical protein
MRVVLIGLSAEVDLQFFELCLAARGFKLGHVVFDILLQLLERLGGVDFYLKVKLLPQLEVDSYS